VSINLEFFLYVKYVTLRLYRSSIISNTSAPIWSNEEWIVRNVPFNAKLTPEEIKHLPRYTFDGSCRYSRHDSLAVGRLTMLNADCVYSTWKIQIQRISFFFPLKNTKPHKQYSVIVHFH
jgi:hypothetical protein